MRLNSFKDKAFKTIRKDIIANRLAPGQSLNERALSQRLKISKTPIREAIQLLHKEGLVDFVPQKGAFVSHISIYDIREIMQIREGLEPIAAGIAASNHDLKALSDLEKEFASIQKDSPMARDAMFEVGKRCHIFLIDSTRNQRLIDFLDNLRDQMDRIRSMFYLNLSMNYIEQKCDEHIRILKAVKEEDSANAELLMRQHIRDYWEKIKDLT